MLAIVIVSLIATVIAIETMLVISFLNPLHLYPMAPNWARKTISIGLEFIQVPVSYSNEDLSSCSSRKRNITP